MRARLALALLLALALSACNLSSEPDEFEPLVTATSGLASRPAVTIVSPQNNTQVAVGERVLVSASATDAVGVQRVQLMANGQIVKTVSSESASGDRAMNVVLDYTPREQGTVNVQVVAYRGATTSDPATLTLVVGQRAQATATPVTGSNPTIPTGPVIDPNDPTCRALTNTGLNLRVGPGTNYAVIRTLAAGTQVPIVGRLGRAQDEWWQVRSGTTFGWVSAPYTTQYGNCGAVPVIVPPPTPTGTVPTATTAPSLTPPPTWTVPPAVTTPPPLPDLVVSNISGPSTLSLAGGATEVAATFGVTVTNTGGSPTGQFNNALIKIPGNVQIPLGVVATLGRNESILLTVEVTFDAPGTYALQVNVDSESAVNEFSEVNNAGFYTVTVSS